MLLLLAVALVVWVVFSRSGELFVVSWRNGESRLVRGRIPPMLRSDLVAALQHMKVQRCTVKAYRAEGGAQLDCGGLDDFSAQRLKNIFRLYPLAQLRAAPPPSGNVWLRLLGISYLSWLWGRRD